MAEEKKITLRKLDNCRWEIPIGAIPGMNVPGIIYASEELLPAIESDQATKQVANVACLPGICGASLAMPDIHWGYGFPIGGVAATDPEDGVISPGGVGYDISCGVRLIRTNLVYDEIKPKLKELVYSLFDYVPCGVGQKGNVKLSPEDMRQVLKKGVPWTIEQGWGNREDLDFLEEGGCLQNADVEEVSQDAKDRGSKQLGTLGSGNHFLEVQVVEELFDERCARGMGLEPNQVVVMIHSGSRGLGYQVCDDFLDVMRHAVNQYGISLPDSQLACVPIKSEEGQRYIRAMNAAANFGMSNRQLMTHFARECFMKMFNIGPKDLGMEIVYDVCHNIAKMEEHKIHHPLTSSLSKEGELKKLVCVHRKGATRAFPAGHPQTPKKYQDIGQPVLVPGDMGRYSYVLAGLPGAMEQTFGSTCHGAGRMLSRTKAKQSTKGRAIERELEDRGIYVKSRGRATLHEEVSEAYKDVSLVVDICEKAGISKKVAKLHPVGVIKG